MTDMPDTPVTTNGLRSYDDLPPFDAIVAAWTRPGPRPDLHRRCRAEVRRLMPLLGRALDRAATVAATWEQDDA